ncbi:MAG TPA: P1 family peptidase [Acidimicrobiales bacterium]
MITDIDGVRVGHWTDPVARTGCTVVLFPEGTVASGEVRGGAPAARETALLDPTKAVSRLDAVVLTGGSAFGLASADGVMRFCEERGLGVPTPAGPVPIVVGLGLFDLPVGDPAVRPGPDQGYAACEAARSGAVPLGPVGAGTGATVGAPAPTGGERLAGGVASVTVRSGDLAVGVLVVVNAYGAVGVEDSVDVRAPGRLLGNTTIGVVATNARLDKVGCHLLAQSAHDGLARAIFPAHTRFDGDAFVAAAVGTLGADGGVGSGSGSGASSGPSASAPSPGSADRGAQLDAARSLTTHAVAAAIRTVAPPSPAG